MSNMERVIFGCLLTLGFVPAALACSTGAWSSTSGATAVGSPPTVTRVSEFCGLKLTGTGHVQDNSPQTSTITARFYVLPQFSGTGNANLLTAYSNDTATTPLFTVNFNGTQFVFNASGAGGGSGNAAAAAGWNLIEVAFNSGGTFSFWVNKDATSEAASGSFASGTGTVQAVRLGLPGGFGGFTGSVSYDAYESHVSTPVGPLLIGDANGANGITIADVIAVGNELNGTLAGGQPDCNNSGSVTIADVICVGNKLL